MRNKQSATTELPVGVQRDDDGLDIMERTMESAYTASLDALHIATATVNGMDYLLTWNCRHIANATLQRSMRTICEESGYVLPILCTPIELTEAPRND